MSLHERWNDFYSQKGVRFYKDRHWLRRELVELMPLSVRSSPLAWCAPLAGASEGEATSVVRCSAACVTEFGEDTRALSVLLTYLKAQAPEDK